MGRIEADEVARQRHAGRPPCRFELESHGLSPRSDHLLGQPRSRASAGSPIEFASIVGQPPFVPRADERPGRCRGVGGREALGDVAGDLSVVARDHIGHRAVGREDDRGWKRLQHERLRQHALRIAGERAHTAKLRELLSDRVHRHLLGIEADGEVPHGGPLAAMTAGMRGDGIGQPGRDLRHDVGGRTAALEEEFEHDNRSPQLLPRHGRAIRQRQRSDVGRLADLRMHRLGRLQGLEPRDLGGAGGDVKGKHLRGRGGVERGPRKLDLHRDAHRTACLPRQLRGIGGGRHLHAPQELRLAVDPEFEHAVGLHDLDAGACPAIDRLRAQDPRGLASVCKDQVDGVVGEQQRQLRGAAGLPFGEGRPHRIVREDLIHGERARDGLGEHLPRHPAHCRKQPGAVGCDPRVVGIDADPVGPREGDPEGKCRVGGQCAAGLPHDDTGVVGIGGRAAVGPAHLGDQAPWILAAAGEEDGCGEGRERLPGGD